MAGAVGGGTARAPDCAASSCARGGGSSGSSIRVCDGSSGSDGRAATDGTGGLYLRQQTLLGSASCVYGKLELERRWDREGAAGMVAGGAAEQE